MYDAAVAGDKVAKDIFEYTGTILGQAFADMVAFSSPQAIILFGGLAKAATFCFVLSEKRSTSQYSYIQRKDKDIAFELKESDAAVLGASALGWEAKYKYEVPSLSIVRFPWRKMKAVNKICKLLNIISKEPANCRLFVVLLRM